MSEKNEGSMDGSVSEMSFQEDENADKMSEINSEEEILESSSEKALIDAAQNPEQVKNLVGEGLERIEQHDEDKDANTEHGGENGASECREEELQLSPQNGIDSSDPLSPLKQIPDQVKEPLEAESVYDMTDTQVNDLNDSYLDGDANKENEGVNKRRSDEGLEIRDELDFEEEKESAEEGEESDGEKKSEPINKEEGELSDEDEDESLLRQEPKTVCRFFNKGQCTWGTNCRFLHPGVSDKGNYNMFAAPKPTSQSEKDDKSEKERHEVRRFIPEPVGYESAWERGLRHAKEMMKRANKRKETDADFEEKRFNLSLGQAELDRENDYYTRPASPVCKPTDEVIEYLDPYEKQAIRHFRGGHFENFEVRYKVDPNYTSRGGQNNSLRSRRDKFEREVTERIPRRLRPASPLAEEPQKVIKEKRYPRPRVWKEERVTDQAPVVMSKAEAESWADPWARPKTPVKRIKKKKPSRTRSYSSASSSRSSRSSRSSSYSSYSRSGSRSTSRSRSSRSSSRSITPPIHPRQQRATMNRGGVRGGRGGIKRMVGPQRNLYPATPQFSQPPNPPPNHPLAPDVSYGRQPVPPMGNRRGVPPRDSKDVVRLPLQIKQEPRKFQTEPRERITNPIKADPRNLHADPRERVDMFGRTIRKDIPRSPTPKSQSRSPIRSHGRRKFSLSPSCSHSRSRSRSSSGSSRSRSASHSDSRSGSGSRSRSRSRSSSSASSISAPPSPISKRKAERGRRVAPGIVSYGEAAAKSKVLDLVKVAGQKQQIKLSLKKPGPAKPVEKPVVGVDDDSGESDTDARILKKRKAEPAPPNPTLVVPKKPRAVSPTDLASLTSAAAALASKKPSAARREELLKQLRAVEDAIARKRSKPLP